MFVSSEGVLRLDPARLGEAGRRPNAGRFQIVDLHDSEDSTTMAILLEKVSHRLYRETTEDKSLAQLREKRPDVVIVFYKNEADLRFAEKIKDLAGLTRVVVVYDKFSLKLMKSTADNFFALPENPERMGETAALITREFLHKKAADDAAKIAESYRQREILFVGEVTSLLTELSLYQATLGRIFEGLQDVADSTVIGLLDKAVVGIEGVLVKGRRLKTRLSNQEDASQKRNVPFYPNVAVNSVVEANTGKLKEAKVRLRLNLDNTVPRIVGEEISLCVAIQHLLFNAIEATPPGGEIIIGSRLVGSKVEISVRDSGRGIPEGVRDKIFQTHYTFEKPGNLGLGLAMVASIVGDFKGSIEYKPGEHGTTFKIFLPAVSGWDSE